MRRHLLLLFLLLIFIPSGAAGRDLPMPAELTPAIDHLLDQVSPGPHPPLEPQRLEPLIRFVLDSTPETLYFENGEREDTTSSYLAFELPGSLERLSRYAFNPQIPSHLFNPSSLRFVQGTFSEETMSRLGEASGAMPVLVRGSEHEEITPDLSTGTYFTYDLDRTLIRLQWQGRPVLISLARQKDRSQAGKKGEVLGADTNWDYLYSEEKGVGIPGLGWADSYMYRSLAINIFIEKSGGHPTLRCGSFKWLRAGWKGLNMVRRHHIYDGQVRYARDLKLLLGHPKLPSAESLAAACGRLAKLPAPQRQELSQAYLRRLQRQYGGKKSDIGRKMAELLQSGAILDRMGHRELEAVLALELFKGSLGHPHADPLIWQRLSR